MLDTVEEIATAPTRDRLLAAAIRLFAAQGFEATSVGEIESAVGLQPRRGALYKHFESKEALLHAAVDQCVLDMGRLRLVAKEHLPEDSGALTRDQLRGFVMHAGRQLLAESDAHRDLTHILEHEGDRLSEVRERVRREVHEPGYRETAEIFGQLAGPGVDAQALTTLLLASLVGLRRIKWTLGAAPFRLSDRRALEAWTDLVLSLIDLPDDTA